ncbi:PREDICTED: uncharacterized protein LOC104806327 [Tarenaya hassleriana]|uniref:uncharacterized protein LOC104806327 n=1 Tax=Tarenaya hassleriana TaxID=28532 RepID=UPI00053C4AF2|nr:PREDICTED: uncharacterized protein LOC104806327 [Tarenaya hassleriana]
MEGVGARLGRSSTRYGPATVFTGPVRKWKKKWVHVSPSNKKDSSSATAPVAVNGGSAADESNGSHLLLYKWTPLSQSNNGNGNGGSNGKREGNSPSGDSAEEPPRRKFKYVPIAVLEEQKRETPENEDEDKVDEEDAKPSDNDRADSDEKQGGMEEKPDINDVPVEDNQEDGKMVRQDLNKSTLDLSLNLNAQDGDSENEQRAEETDH